MRKAILPIALLLALLAYYLYPRDTQTRSSPGTSNQEESASKPTKKKSSPPTRAAPQAMQNAGGGDFEDDPPGELRLEGQVIDEDGKPISGAMVGISSVPSRQTSTDEKGWFFFDKLVSRTYYVEAHKDNLYGSASSLLNDAATPVTIRMQEGGSVELTVLDEVSREPIPNAEISWGWSVKIYAHTDTLGKALIQGLDRWTYVYINAEGYSPSYVEAPTNNDPKNINKKTALLKKGASVSGIVLSPSDEPVAKARISIEGDQLWGIYDDEEDEIMSNEEGKWTVPTLPAGTVRFTAKSEEFAVGYSESVTIDGKTPKDGVVIRLEPGGIVKGKVVSNQGEPIVGAIVRGIEDSDGWSRNTRRAYTDESGAFTLKGMPRKPLKLGASYDGNIATPQTVDLTNGSAEVTLTLDIAGTISGVVVDQRGEPIAEAEVRAQPPMDMGSQQKWRMRYPQPTISDPDGKFELKGIVEGEDYVLSAEFPGMSFGAWGNKDNVVKARAGDQNVKLVLKEKGKVKGRVQLKSGGAPKEFTVSVGWEARSNFTDKESGEFLLEEVAPGGQTVLVEGASFRRKITQRFDIKPGETTDVGTIIVESGRTVKGRVTVGGQPVTNAAVIVDQWIGGGGSRLSEEQDYNKNTRALSKEDGTFLIAGLDEDEELTAIAEHPTLGRSQAIKIAKNSGDQEIELTLQEGGTLEGVITREGKPAEAFAQARDEQHSRASFSVSTGPDGKYRFDSLTPGKYEITAGLNDRSSSNVGAIKTTIVTIEAKKTSKLNFTLTSGVNLIVSPMQYGKLANRASVHLISGSFTATDTETLEALTKDLTEDQMRSGHLYAFVPGASPETPLKFLDVQPGTYTLCVSQGLESEEWENMSDEERKKPRPLLCQPQTIAATPQEQSITINLPEWYPPESP